MRGLGRHRQTILMILLALLIAGGVLLLSRLPAAGRVEVTLATPAPTASPAPLRVYVSGAVARPDVYALAPGSLVKDAIQAAGGATADADLTRINLAQAVTDQSQVLVPAIGEAAPATTRGQGASVGLINLNTASADELDTLPGIGPALAQRIIERRPYHSVQELMEVPGIGPVTYEKLKDKVTAP